MKDYIIADDVMLGMTETWNEIAAWVARAERGPISDGAARTIAQKWRGENQIGNLVLRNEANVKLLFEDLQDARDQVRSLDDALELAALTHWVNVNSTE